MPVVFVSPASSIPPMPAAGPAYVNSNGGVSSVSITTNSQRSRRTYNSSDLVFSIDDDGRGYSLRDEDDAILGFYQHNPTTGNTTPTTTTTNAFFQAHIYGGLRKGSVNTTLFSRQYAGYVLSALTSGYMYVAIEYVLMRLEPETLGLKTTRDVQGLLNLQWAVVLGLGLVSDAYAPFGYRRNAYIIFGWVLASLVWAVLFLLFQFSDQVFRSQVPPPEVAVVGITAATLALVIATNALDIRVIELSQQEELYTRGRLVATYQSVRIGTQVVLHALILAVTSTTLVSSLRSSTSASRNGAGSAFSALVLPFPIQFFFLHLMLMALLPIPFLAKFAQEEKLAPESAAPHFLETCRQFTRYAQQKAIWQLVAFNCVLYFFALLDFTEVSKAIGFWTSDSSPQVRLWRSVISDSVFIVALLLWKNCGVNVNWVTTIAFVLVSWSLVYLTGNTLIAFDVVRSPWIVTILSVLRVGLRVLLLLSAFVPTIEVAQQGSEGMIFGLLSSFQNIARVLGAQLMAVLRDDGGLVIRVDDLAANSASIQRTVFWGVLVMTGVKLLSLIGLWFCPQQKLDAQQLRIYGGYSRRALVVFVVVYADAVNPKVPSPQQIAQPAVCAVVVSCVALGRSSQDILIHVRSSSLGQWHWEFISPDSDVAFGGLVCAVGSLVRNEQSTTGAYHALYEGRLPLMLASLRNRNQQSASESHTTQLLISQRLTQRLSSGSKIDMKQLDASTTSTTSTNTSTNVAMFMDTLGTTSLLQLPERQTLPSADIVLSFDDNEFNISSCNNTNTDCPAMLDYQQYHQGHHGQHRRQLTPMMIGDSYNQSFFSMQTFGGVLRKGGAVTLFSKHYYGYALSAVCSGYMYVAIEFVLMRFPYSELGIRPSSVQGLKDLLHLQWSIVLALGLLSDSYAPFRYRRNGYILCGWVAVSAFWCALFVFFQFSESIFGTKLPPANAAIACITGAMLFLVVLTNAADIRVVELSQQEELHRRGRLVATYQILRIGAQVCAHTLVKLSGVSAQYSKRNDVELDVTPVQAQLFVLHLSVLALVPVPFVVHHAREEKLGVHAAKSQFVETCRQFWRSAQQKAIWQLIAFNCVLYFFSFLEYKDVSRALAIWNQQSPQGKLTQSVLSDTAFVVALLLWKWFGVNANWIKTTAGVIVSWTLLYFAGNSLVALDVVRQQPWIAVVMSVLRAGFRVLLLFSAFIPTIEVAQIGSEGTIFGLLSSFQAIVKALGAQLSDAIMDDAEGLQINLKDVAAVNPIASTNTRVFYWVLALTCVKLLSLTALFFCPQQKLDAQQLRIYGGYSRVALGVFLVLYGLSYPYASYLQYSRLSV